MRQLSTLDAQFLAVESARTYGHVGGLAVYDPSTAPGGKLEMKDLCRLVGERLHLLPPFRARLRERAPPPAVPLAARERALRPGSAVLDRGPRLRPGLPHPRLGRAAARERAPARGD